MIYNEAHGNRNRNVDETIRNFLLICYGGQLTASLQGIPLFFT